MQLRTISFLGLAMGAVASPVVAARDYAATACAIVSSSASAFLAASPKGMQSRQN